MNLFWEQFLTALAQVLLILLSIAIPCGLLVLLIIGVWKALSAGLKRDERAHCFLRLLEVGFSRGRTLEETIATLAQARVRELGVLFHLLAAWMQRGLSLGAALKETPRFLPPQISAMLRVGESTGQIERMLPLCRTCLGPGSAQSRKQLNNLMALFFVSPAGPVVLWVLAVFVLPKFRQIAVDLEAPPPPYIEQCFEASFIIAGIMTVIWGGLWLLETARGGGGWVLQTMAPPTRDLLDWIQLRIPWKLKRLHRDFSAMLASLLDAGIPEASAVQLAAEATANSSFQHRAASVTAALREGIPLADALQRLDASGEFRWRLRNSSPSRPRFSAALHGWIESLDARAFQQEQFFSQLATSAFVLLNGLMVGLAVVSVFRFLIGMIDSIAW